MNTSYAKTSVWIERARLGMQLFLDSMEKTIEKRIAALLEVELDDNDKDSANCTKCH